MIQVDQHEGSYLSICKHYRAIYDTPCILEDSSKWQQVHRLSAGPWLYVCIIYSTFDRCFLSNPLLNLSLSHVHILAEQMQHSVSSSLLKIIFCPCLTTVPCLHRRQCVNFTKCIITLPPLSQYIFHQQWWTQNSRQKEQYIYIYLFSNFTLLNIIKEKHLKTNNCVFQALKSVVLYVILAPYDNEQSDLVHRISEDKKLEEIPKYK